MAKFSVVIAVYNKEAYILKTLESVLTQSFSDFEIIVLNDGSTDSSEEIIKKVKNARLKYFSQQNMGVSAARNAAIKMAAAPFIALLDADDIWYPGHLSEINRLVEKYPAESVFAANSEIVKKGNVFKREYSIDVSGKKDLVTDYFEASQFDSILHSSSTVLKKDVFDVVGYYDPAFKSVEDIDFYVRIGLKYRIVFSPKTTVKYNSIAGSLSQTSRKTGEKADFSAYENFEKENPALKKFLDLNRYSLCLLAKLEGNDSAFSTNFEKIDLKNLSKKQVFLLKQNAKTLKFLFKTKENLQNLGFRLSVFK